MITRILILLVFLLLSGCGLFSEKEIVYVKPDLPFLETYPLPPPLDLGQIINEGEFACVKRWRSCIPRKDLIEIINYATDLKSLVLKGNSQAIEHNVLLEKMKNDD